MNSDLDENQPREVALSRSGVPSPIGKLDTPVKFLLPFETDAAFARMCNEADTSRGELLRDFVCDLVHGKTFSELQAEQAKNKREALLNKGRVWGRNRDGS